MLPACPPNPGQRVVRLAPDGLIEAWAEPLPRGKYVPVVARA